MIKLDGYQTIEEMNSCMSSEKMGQKGILVKRHFSEKTVYLGDVNVEKKIGG